MTKNVNDNFEARKNENNPSNRRNNDFANEENAMEIEGKSTQGRMQSRPLSTITAITAI